MCKSQKPTVQTTNQQTVMPEYVQAAQKNLLSTGQNILSPYLNAGTSGYGVAGFNTAFQGARDMFQSAQNGGGALNPADITKYLNPYTQNVVDTTNQNLRDQNDITLNGIRARAAAGSSFGGSGSRAALMETAANKDLGNTIASTTAQLMASGYDKATATAMASQQQDLAYRSSTLQQLLGTGTAQQELEQTKNDVPLKALQNLLAITPQQYGSSTTGTTTTTGQQGPSALQTILGGGLSILGMGTGGGLAGTTVLGSLLNKLK
jgi:hypothetical protein